ncbi:PLP-dependent transferase [Amycolatopsis sp. GM8]|uniref:aminotransferase class V-fold PLP-dependent enzyme n=1 Tax=Amycolatopsis sp. GM8 TaxID=2896530 RepID=UPI001F008BCD|nr:PLP-dependent transferase [Amycolatopsis sp. GM8]
MSRTACPDTTAPSWHQAAVYRELGVRPVIHAGGTTTMFGGSRPPEFVWTAMAEASANFVHIPELNRAVGKYIATVTGAEAGMVTAGAASALVVAVAAAMTGADPAKVRQLPDTAGLRSRVVIQKAHRGRFTYLARYTGAEFVEVGNTNECYDFEVESALDQHTAAILYLLGPGQRQLGPTIAETAQLARRAGVPLIVDAAGMLPPKRNLTRFIAEGADLVMFGGGKFLRGPQNSGLLFGRSDLIEAALAHSGPNYGIGRAHKMSRETIVGVYEALKAYVSSDEDKTLAAYRAQADRIRDGIGEIPGVEVTVRHDDFEFFVPTTVVSLTPEWTGPEADEIARRLLSGEPRVFLYHDRQFRRLTANPTSLQDGEAEIVGRRMRDELAGARHGLGSQ